MSRFKKILELSLVLALVYFAISMVFLMVLAAFGASPGPGRTPGEGPGLLPAPAVASSAETSRLDTVANRMGIAAVSALLVAVASLVTLCIVGFPVTDGSRAGPQRHNAHDAGLPKPPRARVKEDDLTWSRSDDTITGEYLDFTMTLKAIPPARNSGFYISLRVLRGDRPIYFDKVSSHKKALRQGLWVIEDHLDAQARTDRFYAGVTSAPARPVAAAAAPLGWGAAVRQRYLA